MHVQTLGDDSKSTPKFQSLIYKAFAWTHIFYTKKRKKRSSSNKTHYIAIFYVFKAILKFVR